MKWLLIAVIVGLIAVVAIVGLSVKHTATLCIRLARPPANIWKAITEVEAFPSWRPDVFAWRGYPTAPGTSIQEGK